jgi:3-hydroxyisobutyrate dehydrogenase
MEFVMAKIAFIGLGNMGLPMALNLARAGHQVAGFDFLSVAMDKAREGGIMASASGSEAVWSADVVVTMLPSGKHLLRALTGATGLLAAAKPGTLFIDCSTIDIASARAAHEAATKAGMKSVDAPVSGGVGGAAAGTLTFMIGGEPDIVSEANPILSAMGKKLVHCGGAGAGQAAKICNNMILGISMIAVSEAFVLGEKLGLSHQALFDVASTSSGQCWSLTSYCPAPGMLPTAPANDGYKPGFAAPLMLKDLKLAEAAAVSTATDNALGRQAAKIYESFVAAGGDSADFSGVINFIRSAPGV